MTSTLEDVASEEAVGASVGAFGAWFAVTATVLSGIAPLLLIGSTPLSPSSSPSWPWAWLLTFVVGLRYAWLVAQGRRRLFELIFWLFTYAFLGLAPLVQMRTGRYAETTPYLETSLNASAMALIGLGTAAFAVGAYLGRGQTAQRSSDHSPPRVHEGRTISLTVFSLLLAAFYTSRIGLGAVLGSRDTRSAREAVVFPNVSVAAVARASATLPLVISIAALLVMRHQQRRQGRPGPIVLPATVCIVLAFMVNPFSSARYVTGTALLTVLVALGAVRTARRTRVFALVIALGLVLVFPYADIARHADTTAAANSGGVTTQLSTGDFDAFDQVNNTLAYVRSNGTENGRQLLGAALFWVPRSVWASKPEDTGALLGDFRGYRFTNLSEPIIGEFFINGGWLLVALGMVALGYVVRRWDTRSLVPWRSHAGTDVLAATLPFYSVLILRGSLLQAMAGLAVLVASGLYVRRSAGDPGGSGSA